MIDSFDPKITEKPVERCSRCDRETEHYNVWFDASNGRQVVCWECRARKEKGFFAHRGFRRGARSGVIPR
ncbi:MAG: hypothetical protein IPM25_15520 [Chloracidobacterium sp.]|nr:hypothetical protein [Chloracidobacterium sp.]